MSDFGVPLTVTLDAGLLEELVQRITARVLERLEATTTSWMNLETTANYLDWPKKRLYNLVAKGQIPHRKQGGRLLFNRAELDQWLDGLYQGPEEFAS